MLSELKMVSSKIIFPGGQGIPHSIIILRVMVLFIAKTVLWLEDPMKGMSMSSINDLKEEKNITHCEKPCFNLNPNPKNCMTKNCSSFVIGWHSMAKVNLYKSEELVTKESASIEIPPFQTSLHKIFKNCFLWSKSCSHHSHLEVL